MMHANESKIGSLTTLIFLKFIPLTRDRIKMVCTATVTRLGNKTVDGTVYGFAAHLTSELAL